MYIKITLKDAKNIVNQSLQGGGKHSDLEVALAKKVVSLSETLANINNERNEMFEALYSIGLKLSKGSFAQGLADKRKKDLMALSKAHYQAMLDTARQAENIDTGATNGKDTTDNPNKECN